MSAFCDTAGFVGADVGVATGVVPMVAVTVVDEFWVEVESGLGLGVGEGFLAGA